MLTRRAMEVAPLHEISSATAVDKAWNKKAQFFQSTFRVAMRGHIKYQDFLRVPREYLPTGREHIKALQRAAEKDLENQVHSSSTMMFTMVSLLGARRSMEVQANVWGGDSRMDQKLPAATFVEESQKVYNDLKTLTKEELEGLYTQAIKGHGGALDKAFEQTMYHKTRQMDQLPQDELDAITAKALDGHGGKMVESFNENNTFTKRVEAVMSEYKYGTVNPRVDVAPATNSWCRF